MDGIGDYDQRTDLCAIPGTQECEEMFSGCESADLCPNIDELEKNDRTKNKRERQKAFQGNSDANPTGS